jgi:putative restriction endonuclease
MHELADSLERVDGRHRTALSWFANRRDEVVGWPAPLDDGTLLATRAKGIYKPIWTHYALSIRLTLDGPYPDLSPAVREDGSWVLRYFQENLHAQERNREFTNRALLACSAENIPVGVLTQVSRKPSRYKVLGLARVVGWNSGYFLLEGFNQDGQAH